MLKNCQRLLMLTGNLLAILLVAACANAQPDTIPITATPGITTVPSSATPRSPVSADPDDTVINPLTGLPVADPAVLQRRPLAVKISNAPVEVRPQAGINAADHVYEHYVEGNLTRFTAIYWTHTPPRVGSVRSARLLDLELPAMYGALFAYSGAAEPIRQRIAGLPFADRAYEGVAVMEPLYFRDPGIEAPHNLFTIPAAVWDRAAADDLADPPTLSNPPLFTSDPRAESTEAARVTIDYGPDEVQWVYDAETGRYTRTVNGEFHHDANDGTPVTAANVVLIYAHHQEDLSIVESEWQGNRDFSIEIQIWTLGPAVILRDGRMIEGYWQRWEENDLLSFWADEAATQRLTLTPGNTWFQVVPLDFARVRIEKQASQG